MKNKTLFAALVGLGIVTVGAAIVVGKKLGRRMAKLDDEFGWGDGDCGYDCDCDDCMCGHCCEDAGEDMDEE